MKFSLTNLNLYKSFLAVCETHSMSRAASVLGTTQPNITHNIKELERQLDVKLFFSGPRGMTPTKEAETLYPEVFAALGSINNAENLVKEFNEKSVGCVRIGCPSHFAGSVLMDSIKLFRKTYRNISLDIYSEPIPSMIEMLKKQELDVLILTSKLMQALGKDYKTKEIRKLDYEFVASKSFIEEHDLNAGVTAEKLKSLPVIVHRTSPSYKEMIRINGLKSTQIIHTSSVALTYKLVLNGLGVGRILKDFIETAWEKGEIAAVNIEGMKPGELTLLCAYDKTITDKKVLAFIKTLGNI